MYHVLSLPVIATAVTVYFCGVIFYRLTLHPLARFPGPKLAAITRYYEAYFDVVQNGKYTFKIREMHRRYGPIVRISPYELHVNDAAFFSTLYRQDAQYDKYDWALAAMAADGASIFTPSHHLHKARRQPMNSFFSKAKVAQSQDMILRHLNKLCNRFSQLARAETSFDFGASMTAFARDIANDFILNKSYNSLDRDDFDVGMLRSSQGAGSVWRLNKFLPWFAPTLQKIPISWIMKVVGEDLKQFLLFLQEGEQNTKNLMKAATSPATDHATTRTIVHEIMDSKLPPSEKTLERVFPEVNLVTGAGFETTATALRLIFYHIFSDVSIVTRLRSELISAGATADRSLDLKTLEQLPYLSAVLTEGLRLSPGIATRMQRIARDSDLFYNQWRIPAGTPVGMTLLLLHTDEKLFPDPSRYNPDRWLVDGVLKQPEQGFAPFSKGPRSCLGMHLAWAEMYMVVADVIQHFDLSFERVTAQDFEAVCDNFGIGTKGHGHAYATISLRQA